MVKYRDKLEIIADVLKGASSGAKKTKIMYSANLSFVLLGKYLDETMESGFLRLNGDGYEVTEKGRAFLEKYNEFSTKFSEIEKTLRNLQFEKEVLERMCESSRDFAKTSVGRKLR